MPDRNGDFNIYLIDANGSNPAQLTLVRCGASPLLATTMMGMPLIHLIHHKIREGWYNYDLMGTLQQLGVMTKVE